MDRIFELADQLTTLRDEKKKVKERLEKLNAAMDDAEYKLSEAMAATETQSFSRAGTLFYLTTTTRASAVAGARDVLFNALKTNGYGDLVYETVNANSLSSFVKEQIAEHEDRLPGWLEGLVSVFEETTVGVRKATKK
ncbi:MAG: hypothetical protein FWF69_09640 [Firmicutes bacterium]|nr:hypothetical protein [Bacillota bacterium]